jgi:hypothetical protein
MKKTILVHCLHGVRPPRLFCRNYAAVKKCTDEPGYQIVKCRDEREASELFAVKNEEYLRELNKSRIAILKANLEKRPSASPA